MPTDHTVQVRKEHCQDNSTRATGGEAPANINQFTEHSKLLPWLMLCAIISALALGISIMIVVNTTQSESRTRAELDKQNRFLQEYRIRVEDAEIAAEEVNPKFHPRRTE